MKKFLAVLISSSLILCSGNSASAFMSQPASSGGMGGGMGSGIGGGGGAGMGGLGGIGGGIGGAVGGLAGGGGIAGIGGNLAMMAMIKELGLPPEMMGLAIGYFTMRQDKDAKEAELADKDGEIAAQQAKIDAAEAEQRQLEADRDSAKSEKEREELRIKAANKALVEAQDAERNGQIDVSKEVAATQNKIRSSKLMESDEDWYAALGVSSFQTYHSGGATEGEDFENSRAAYIKILSDSAQKNSGGSVSEKAAEYTYFREKIRMQMAGTNPLVNIENLETAVAHKKGFIESVEIGGKNLWGGIKKDYEKAEYTIIKHLTYITVKRRPESLRFPYDRHFEFAYSELESLAPPSADQVQPWILVGNDVIQ